MESFPGEGGWGSSGSSRHRRFPGLSPAGPDAGEAERSVPAGGGPSTFLVRAGEAPRGMNRYLGGIFACKVSGADTGGGFCVFDTLRREKGGPGKHVHAKQDEWFYVVRGEFLFEIGEERFRMGPGDSALGPRGVPHAFARVGEETGQLLVVFQPAHRIEEMFREAAALLGHGGMADNLAEPFAALVRKYDIEVVGPPLAVTDS